MKKLFTLLVASILFVFISCERHSDIAAPATGDNPSVVEEQSPIKGIWECQLDGVKMTFVFSDDKVEYKYYIERFNASAIYKGAYTIKDSDITLEFRSISTKNSSGIEYYAPEKMPKEAIFKDENTIIYIDNSYTRK